MRATNFLIALILMLAASACAPVDLPEKATSGGTAVEASEQAAAATAPVKASEQTATVTAPVEATEPAATITTPPEAPEQTATVTVPVEAPEPLSGSDMGQIYATAVRQVYTVDHSFGGDPPDFSLVYIVTTTDDGSMLDAPVSAPQKLSAELQQAIAAGLTDLPFEIKWVESFDDVPVDPNNGQIAGGEGIVITLGNILPQDDDTVQLPFFMACGGLCALGKTYVLDEVGGQWQVTGSVGPEVMA